MSEYIKKNRFKVLVIVAVFISAVIWSAASNSPSGLLSIKVLDVGQGDSIFIKTPSGYKILIDGGPSDKVLDYLGSELPFYDKTLDLVVLTHPQSDHLVGLIDVARRYEIKSLWVSDSENSSEQYKEWEQVLSSKDLERTVVEVGDTIRFEDGVELKVVWPKGELSTSDLNAKSIVILLDYKDFEMLLTGDADKQVQPYSSFDSDIEVLKVPHHGAKAALNESYTKTLSPEVSIISVGERNRYGHPTKNTTDFLISIGSEILRTDLNGTVEIVTNGINWYTKVER